VLKITQGSSLCLTCSLLLYYMPLFVWFRSVLAFCFERLSDCFPDRLTTSLTVLEIVYYLVATTLFIVQLVLLCTGRSV
jgi:hypothetical protein